MVPMCLIMLSNSGRRFWVRFRGGCFKLTCREQLQFEWTSVTYHHKSRQLHSSIFPTNIPVKFTSERTLIAQENPHLGKDRPIRKQSLQTYSAWNSHSSSISNTVQHTSNAGNSLTENSQVFSSDPDSDIDSDIDSDSDSDCEDKLSDMDSVDLQLPRESRKYPSRKANVVKVINLLVERESVIRRTAAENGLEDKQFNKCMKKFIHKISSRKQMGAAERQFKAAVDNISNGKGHIDDLIPFFINYARKLYPLLGPKLELHKTSNMALPPSWFPLARAVSRRLIYHAGPTNSGKTHSAIHHFLRAESAIYCAPLRMLAHEIFHRSNKEDSACDLLTGEEVQFASEDENSPAPRLSCTVEMASLGKTYDVAVIDEIQMIEDSQRGGAWTRALLGLPAREIHLCGHECAVGLVGRLASSMGEPLEVQHYERLSPLVPLKKSLFGHYDTVRPGDCIVTFSRNNVFQVRKKIEMATRQQCAVIYGGLPPATRVRQAEHFNNPNSKCNILVATDAIGMGLNLNIRRIVFHTMSKYDGSEVTLLTSGHTKQIAGRAGRYGKDHSQGEVTTFEQEELPTLHKLLKQPVDKVKQAGLYPSVEQIELFSNHLPNAQLHEILSLFYKMAKLDGNYFLCDFVSQIELAASLKDTAMSLQDLFKFSLAPVDMKKTSVIRAIVQFAHAHGHGEEVSLDNLCYILRLRLPLLDAKTVQALARLEEQHEILDLYLWLSMRFSQTFVAVKEVRALQEKVEKTISTSILSQRLGDNKGNQRGRNRMGEDEILAMSDHLADSSPHVFSRLKDLARSNELSGHLSSRELVKLQREWTRSLKKVLQSNKKRVVGSRSLPHPEKTKSRRSSHSSKQRLKHLRKGWHLG